MQFIIGRWHIQITNYKESNKERFYRLFTRRRKNGFCTQCGTKVETFNPHTDILYRKCDKCRKQENKRAKLRARKRRKLC